MVLIYGMISGLIVWSIIAYGIFIAFQKKQSFRISEQHQKMLNDAESQKKEILLNAKNEAFQIVEDAKKRQDEKQSYLDERTARLEQKAENLEKQKADLQDDAKVLERDKQTLETKKQELWEVIEKQNDKLLEITNLSKDEAKTILLKNFETEMQETLTRQMQRMEKEYQEKAQEKARETIGIAVQKLGTDVVSELTVSTVNIPSEEIKGRIIGREGRNINAFQNATGVDLVIDDTPNAVLISCYDLVRRSIAKVALENLISDGRIQPTRIEEAVQNATELVDELMRSKAEDALFELGIVGLPEELVRLIGRLHFRTSYGQNILKHSVECAYLAEHMAHEMGADPHIAKLGALLHDIGKALTHESQESHVALGVDVSKKYDLDERVINAIEAHHGDVPFSCVESMLAQTADAISASRPGARRESVELYLKRLKDLENVAISFEGVQKAYAVQAGREVRVVVDPETIDDVTSLRLSESIAQKIEKQMTYPGQIKVMVTRETRSVQYAA